MQWGKDLALIIRPSNAASNERWPMVHWRRSTIGHDQARSRQLRRRPRLGCVFGVREGQGARLSARVLDEVKPHKVRYYLERRDDEFEQKMAEVLCVYREVELLKKAAKSKKPHKPVAVASYDEKPGIQAIATTAPDLPPQTPRLPDIRA
jgi:hypothetical protein